MSVLTRGSQHRRRSGGLSFLLVVMLLTIPCAAPARGPNPRPGNDDAECEPARCQVADHIASVCPCDGSMKRRAFVSCVSYTAKALVAAGDLAAKCRRAVVRCAARSGCGATERVACWIGSVESPRCRITSTEARCEQRGGAADKGSCCGVCLSTTTTSTTSSSTSTTETPTTTSTSTSAEPTTTSTSTTSTSSSTLLPCGGLFPVCSGSCPPGEVCSGTVLAEPCSCVPGP